MNSVLGRDSTPISMNDSRPKKNVGSEFDDAYTTYLPRILAIDRWPEASTLDPQRSDHAEAKPCSGSGIFSF